MLSTVLLLSCVGLLIAVDIPSNVTLTRDYRSISLVPLEADQAEAAQHNARPGVDFPILSEIPVTSFSCKTPKVLPVDSYFADPETGCQAFHKCSIQGDIAGSYLCPNYTIFDDQAQTCKWFHDVECSADFHPVTEVITTYVAIPQQVPVSPVYIASRPSATVVSSDCCAARQTVVPTDCCKNHATAISSVVPVVVQSAPSTAVVATSSNQFLSNINLIPVNARPNKKFRARRPKKTVAVAATLNVIPVRPESQAGSDIEVETTDVEIPIVANIPISNTVRQQSSSTPEQTQQSQRVPLQQTAQSQLASQTDASAYRRTTMQSGWGPKPTTQPPAVPQARSGWGAKPQSAPVQQAMPVLGSGLGMMNPMGSMGALGMGNMFGAGGLFSIVPTFANGIARTFISPFAFFG